MKRGRNMLILLGILIVCIGAYAVITSYNKKAEEKETMGDALFSVKAENIQTVSIGADTLIKKDGVWVSVNDENAPISGELVEGFLSELVALGYQRSLDSAEMDASVDMGFASGTMISFADNSGTQYTLEIGSQNEFAGQSYLRMNGSDAVIYLVSAEASALFEKTLKDFVEQEALPDLSDATSIIVANANGTLTWNNTGAKDDNGNHIWKRSGDTTVDTAQVETFLSQMSGIVWDEFVTYNASEHDLPTYGLDAPTAIVTVEAPMDNVTIKIGAKYENSYYVQLDGSPMVYRLGTLAENILAMNEYHFDGAIE